MLLREQDKQKLKDRLRSKIYTTITQPFPKQNNWETMDQYHNNIQYWMQQVITDGVRSAVDGLVDELYTQENFEDDMGLTK